MQISTTAPVQNGHKQHASSKAKAICLFSLYMSDKLDYTQAYLYLADAVVEKAITNGRPQKFCRTSEKRSHKKAKTAEIERATKKMNVCTFSLLNHYMLIFYRSLPGRSGAR